MALRRVGAVTLTALAVVLAPTSTVVATAQDPVPPESAGTQMVDEDPEFLALHIDNVTPSTVTTTSDPFVTVTGSVENIATARSATSACDCNAPPPSRAARASAHL